MAKKKSARKNTKKEEKPLQAQATKQKKQPQQKKVKADEQGKKKKLEDVMECPMTIESDEEVEEVPSEDEGEKSAPNKMQKPSGEVQFSFDDEEVFGGSIAQQKESTSVHGWDFSDAIDLLAKQGAKQWAPLLSEEHFTNQKKIAKKRFKDDRKKRAEATQGEAEQTPVENDESTAEIVDDDDEVAADDDDDEIASDGDDDDDVIPPSSSEESSDDDDDDDAPIVDDSVRAMEVTEAEKAIVQRKKRKQKSDGTVVDDDEREDRPKTLDDDEAAKDFFDEFSTYLPNEQGQITFTQLNLSRPLMRAIESMGYVKPTPIQARVVPIALAGRDVCGSAVTGSGKTAAFLLPTLERLLYRPQAIPCIRVLVVAPTRELAAQCHAVCLSLTKFCDPPIMSALITGGTKNLRPQEMELRKQPDIVICTPGRMIDHLTNSAGVHLEELDVLILDEVDRLLELGFQDEVEELVRMCPSSARRQTLLFSATMNTTVESLAKLSLHKPVRVGVDVQGNVAGKLNQEFIRIKKNTNRGAVLVALLTRTFKKRTIVFFDTKVDAHRYCLALRLCGVSVGELHGNLTQLQRLEALQKFRDGQVDVLMATDLAARGLDIPRIETVINFEMPRQAPTYVHRVGRTARAGCGGRSVTLIGESRRLVMKEVLRGMDADQRSSIKSRALAPKVLEHFSEKLESLEVDIEALLKEEINQKGLQIAEMQLSKASNVLQHEDEIKARPARQWFQSEKQKESTRELTREQTEKLEALASGKIIINQMTPAERLKKAMKSAKKGQGAGGGKIESGTHRLSRKKRRRLERLAELDEFAQEANAGETATERAERVGVMAKRKETNKNQVKKMTEDTSLSRQRYAEEMADERSFSTSKDDEGFVGGEYGDELSAKSRKRRKPELLGSSFDMDGNGDETSNSKKKKDSLRGPMGFTEFDPNRVRLKKKKNAPRAGNFKSKSKYKRR